MFLAMEWITFWISNTNLLAKSKACLHIKIEELIEVIMLANFIEEEWQSFVVLSVLIEMLFKKECIE